LKLLANDYFRDLLERLMANRPLPPLPVSGESLFDQRIERTAEALIALYNEQKR